MPLGEGQLGTSVPPAGRAAPRVSTAASRKGTPKTRSGQRLGPRTMGARPGGGESTELMMQVGGGGGCPEETEAQGLINPAQALGWGQHSVDELGLRAGRQHLSPAMAESELSQPASTEGGGHRPLALGLRHHGLPSLKGLPLHNSRRGSNPDPLEARSQPRVLKLAGSFRWFKCRLLSPGSPLSHRRHTHSHCCAQGGDTCGCHTLRTSYSAVGGVMARDTPEKQPALSTVQGRLESTLQPRLNNGR